MKPLSIAARLIACLAVLSLAACAGEPTVGVLLPETGAAASYGDSMKKAIELGFDQLSAAGEAPRVLYGDSQTNPEIADQETRRLKAEGAHVLIAGITSDEAKHILPTLDSVRLPCLSPSASAPSLTKDSKFFFRLFASDELEGSVAGRFLYEERGHKDVLMYTTNTEQARGIEPPFRQMFESSMHGRVVGKVYITDPDWESQSTDLLVAHNPGAVYIIGYDDDTLRVLRHLRNKAFEGTICASSAFYTARVVEENPELVEDVYFPQPAFDVEDERKVAQDFIAAFRNAFDEDPDIYAAHAYDSVFVVSKALREATRLEGGEIRKTMQYNIKEYPGVTGIIQFDDWGNVHHNPVMFIIKDGQVQNFKKYVDKQREIIRQRIIDVLGGR